MKITKIFNNNVVGSFDSTDREIVVMGKGIGFQKKANDLIDEKLIEKIYKIPKTNSSQFEKLVEEMPYEHIAIADEIVSYATDVLGKKLNKNIYITLTDHLSFAIERKRENLEFENALLWEIKRFYNEEFRIGLKALELVEQRLGVVLSEDEAGFIALHIVNAEMNGDMSYSAKAPEIIQDILNIVKYTFGIEIDETSISYERFITHLKFLIQRAVKNKYYSNEDKEFVATFLEKFSESSGCARKIKTYMYKKMNYSISDEELMYLTIHIERIIRRDKETE